MAAHEDDRRLKMCKRTMVWLAVGVLLLAVSALAIDPGVVKKLSAYGFAAEKDGVTLIADVDATHNRGDEKYIPIRVWLGKESKGVVEITRGSFTLTDPKGVSHPVASVEEIRKDYGPNLISADFQYDHKVVQSGDYVSQHFNSFHFVSAPVYFANPGGAPSTLRETGEVQFRTFTGTFLYFANPTGRDPGTYKLTFTDAKGGVSLDVTFTVPWIK
jgi:hypothetical protein